MTEVPEKIDQNVWDVLHQRATDDKKWAEDHEYAKNPDDWPASKVSKQMLKKRLDKSVDQMTLELYNYLNYRAHATSSSYHSNCMLDPGAARDWEKWSKEGVVT